MRCIGVHVHGTMTCVSGWWYIAGAMFVISTVLWRLVVARLAVANPSARLPWFGWPPNRPRGVMLLCFSAGVLSVVGMQFVARGFGRPGERSDYAELWGVPFVVIVALVGSVPQFRHNRRIRHDALRSAESQQPGC